MQEFITSKTSEQERWELMREASELENSLTKEERDYLYYKEELVSLKKSKYADSPKFQEKILEIKNMLKHLETSIDQKKIEKYLTLNSQIIKQPVWVDEYNEDDPQTTKRIQIN